MAKISYRFILTAFFICVVLVMLNKFAFHNALANGAVSLVRTPASFLFERVGFIRATVLEFRNIRSLSIENAKLRQENITLVGRISTQDALERDNDFLRRSLRIVQRISRPTQSAGIFMSQFQGTEYQVMVNKGSSDGVEAGGVARPQLKISGGIFGPVSLLREDLGQVARSLSQLVNPLFVVGCSW